MSTRRKKLEAKLGAWAFGKVRRYVERKSALGAEKLGIKLGRFVYKVSKKHRTRALDNLAVAMPELSEAERERIAKGVFEHFGIVGTDLMRARKRTDQEVQDTVELIGYENVTEALSLGKGALVITGHFGNWERMAQYARLKGHPLHVVARDANDKGLNQEITDLRETTGIKVISRGNAARQILTLLRDGQLVGILPDQNSNETFVPFFGKPCGTVQGPAVLHMRTGAPLLPVYCARVGPVKYKLVVGKPLEPLEGYEGPDAYTAAINNWLESVIREYPEQWLWLHDRWKSAKRKGLV